MTQFRLIRGCDDVVLVVDATDTLYDAVESIFGETFNSEKLAEAVASHINNVEGELERFTKRF